MLSKPNILVCSDLKEMSDYALKSAEMIRRNVGGTIHVIHMADFNNSWHLQEEDTITINDNEPLQTKLLDSLNKTMADQIKRCEVECTREISLQLTYNGIIGMISSGEYDFVIIGHKADSESIFNLGGIASKIVSTSNIPVLVIKKPLLIEIEKIAALVDITYSMEPIISVAEEFSFVFSAKPVVISLFKNLSSQFNKILSFSLNHSKHDIKNKEREVILKWMRAKISENFDEHLDYDLFVRMSEGKRLSNHFVEILERENIDMVIMKRHQRKILEKLFVGSETRKMLEVYNGNILVLPPSN